MLEGAYEGAIQHFTVALDLKPGLVHALISRGFCHLTLGNDHKAQRDFAEVIAKDAGFNRNVYVLIAVCFKRHGDYQTAIRYLSRCVQQFKNFRPALIARGELSLKVREYEKARMDFSQVVNDSPAHLVARRGLGDALRGLGNLRDALRQYSRAIEDATDELNRLRDKADRSNAESGGSDNGSVEAGGNSSSRASPPVGVCMESADNSIVELDQGANDRTLRLEDGSDESSGGRNNPRRAQGNASDDDDRSDDAEVSAQVSRVNSQRAGQDNFVNLAEESVQGPAQLEVFVSEVLLRRALLLRLTGDLENAGADLLDVLQMDSQHGLALFWYAKVLIEQHRHREAPAFLQAALQHCEETRAPAHAILGALEAVRPDPDCDAAVSHLREAARLDPTSQPIRLTQSICIAAASLRCQPHDTNRALSHLDRVLATLTASGGRSTGPSTAPGGRATVASGQQSTPRKHIAGSGGNAAAALSSMALKSPEEQTWSTAKAVVQRRQELAQGDDLALALECATYFQVVAREPQQQVAIVPPFLYALRATAYCEQGRWEEAVADCRRALVLDPDDEATQYNLHVASGVLRSRAAEFEAAVGRFTKAIRLRPVNTELRVHRAIALACAAQACGGNAAGGGSGGVAREGGAGRAMQLLADALQDLEAAEQQALIADAVVPPGAQCLQAAILCGLGRVADAWDVLRSSSDSRCSSRQGGAASPRHCALEAEVLVLSNRYTEAVEACTDILQVEGGDHVEAFLLRGRCWSELGDAERAFEDYRQALILAPERADVHESSGELFLNHVCFQEAVTAFNTSAKLRGSLAPRLAYERAIAQLALGNLTAAIKDMNRALRSASNMPAATRARDGASALQLALDANYRQAHVRLNVLIHTRLGAATDGLPPLFLPHELVLFRGVCSLYLGDGSAAKQDFEAALYLARQLATNEDTPSPEVMAAPTAAAGDVLPMVSSLPASHLGGSGRGALHRPHRLPAEAASEEGHKCFECEMLYNIVLCHLLSRDHRSALLTCQRLLGITDALAALGATAQCLVWFLIGVCHLALGEGQSDSAREAFMHSYAHDPVYVNDFLRRHEPTADHGVGASGPSGLAGGGNGSRCQNPATQFRPIGGCPTPQGHSLPSTRDACDAAPDAICCLQKDRTRLSARLPPCRLQVRDVVIWARPSVAWPFIRVPEVVALTNLARLDLLSHHEVGVNPAPPWDRFS